LVTTLYTVSAHGPSRPGTGLFEPFLRRNATEKQNGTASVFDLRVSKALGDKGYDKVRVSVIAGPEAVFDDFKFTYAEPFKYRWQNAYDLVRSHLCILFVLSCLEHTHHYSSSGDDRYVVFHALLDFDRNQ
jgi:hypothetical protein